MEEKQQKHIIDILFVIALFCLFALSTIFLISVGADIYGKTVNRMEENFNTRTSLAYVTEKVRQADAQNNIYIGTLGEQQALIIRSKTADTTYLTYLYAYGGYLKELMSREDISLGPEAGQDVIALSEFSLLPVNDNLILCHFSTDDGAASDLYISTHSGGILHEP